MLAWNQGLFGMQGNFSRSTDYGLPISADKALIGSTGDGQFPTITGGVPP